MIDMTEALKAACILRGYWTGLIVCGRELPADLEESMSVAHLVAQGEIADGECVDLVEAMMLDADRVENEAVRELARRAGRVDLRIRLARDAVGVHYDRLAESELAYRRRDGVNGVVVQSGIFVVRLNAGDGPEFDLHRSAPQTRLCWWLRDAECGLGNPRRRAGEPVAAYH